MKLLKVAKWIFLLQTIEEAVNQLPDELKERHPEIPWRDIVDFRNLLAHAYWQIDLTTVWTILEPKRELESLKRLVTKLIEIFHEIP